MGQTSSGTTNKRDEEKAGHTRHIIPSRSPQRRKIVENSYGDRRQKEPGKGVRFSLF